VRRHYLCIPYNVLNKYRLQKVTLHNRESQTLVQLYIMLSTYTVNVSASEHHLNTNSRKLLVKYQ